MEKLKKERLDVLLVSRGLAPSREKAKAYIMAGTVYVNGQKEEKAGTTFPLDCSIEVRADEQPFVSRGGYKLDKAIKYFSLALDGLVCMDIGASTGGFTDCMLQNGAKKVFSVDVGHGQLDWKLRNDDRVVCMEKTNIRYVKPEDIGEPLDFASVDVSFISLTKILTPVRALLKNDSHMVCLIKPQFEAGRKQVGKHGVVRDKNVHAEVIENVCGFAFNAGFDIEGLTFSPIRGPEGNIEYLVYLKNTDRDSVTDESENDDQIMTDAFVSEISDIVEEAHKETK